MAVAATTSTRRSDPARGDRCLLWIAAGITPAAAHASLIASEPADGVVLDDPPATIVLTFNEQVAPTVLRLVAPGGMATELRDFHAEGSAIVIAPPPEWGRGTYALTWRVVSADGHPVGGALVFSIGAVTSAPPAGATFADPVVAGAIWLARICLYVGLFIGVGGAFFFDGDRTARRGGEAWPHSHRRRVGHRPRGRADRARIARASTFSACRFPTSPPGTSGPRRAPPRSFRRFSSRPPP